MTAATFLDGLRSSGILTENQWATVLGETPERLKAGDAELLARELVRREVLTRYQAAALREGKFSGLVLGNYVILDLLGRGGMGVVFKARHQRMDRLVALKVVSPKVVGDTAAVARFHREVIAVARLNHPHVVTAFDADLAKGVHFLVMEFVEGTDLADHVKKRGPLPIDEAINLVTQAARGLAHAHAAGIVHRDIKPNNLLLDQKGVVKVLDMGLARFASALPIDEPSTGDETAPFPARAQPPTDHTALTGSGMILGTIDYISPEQAEDTRKADARSDIYSLGCTLFFLLTGRPVYSFPTIAERLHAHFHAKPPTLRSIRAEISEPIDRLYQEMVAKSPADRPVSMEEVIRRLEAISSRSHTHVDMPEAHPQRTTMVPAAPIVPSTSVTPRPMGLSSLLNLDLGDRDASLSLSDTKQVHEPSRLADLFARPGVAVSGIVGLVALLVMGIGGWRYLNQDRPIAPEIAEAARLAEAIKVDRPPPMEPAPPTLPLIVAEESTPPVETSKPIELEPPPVVPATTEVAMPAVVDKPVAPFVDPAALLGIPSERLTALVELTPAALTPAKIRALHDAFDSLLLDHPKSPLNDSAGRVLWQKARDNLVVLRKREESSRWILLDGTKDELIAWVAQRETEGRRPDQIHVHNVGKIPRFTAISAPKEPGIDVKWEIMNAPFDQVFERFNSKLSEWYLVTHAGYWLEDGRYETVALFRTESKRLPPIFAETDWYCSVTRDLTEEIANLKRDGKVMPYWVAANMRDDGAATFTVLTRLSPGFDWQMKGPMTLEEWKATAQSAQTARAVPLTLWQWPTLDGMRFGAIFDKTPSSFTPWATTTVQNADEFWHEYFTRLQNGYELGWIVGYTEAGESRHIVLWYRTGAGGRVKKKG